MIQITPAKITDISDILPILRAEDRAEIIAATGRNAENELPKALNRSGPSYTARTNNGDILAIYGVADTRLPSNIGSPWLVASTHIYDHIHGFLRTSKREFPKIIEGYDYLTNMVDERNTLSQKWLKWLGFNIYDAAPYGPLDMNFHKFDLCRLNNSPLPY